MGDPQRWPRIRVVCFGAVMVACLIVGIALELMGGHDAAHRTLMFGVVFFGGLSLAEARWILGYRAGLRERTEERT